MEEPTWAKVAYPPIDYQAISYYAAPKSKDDRPKSLDEIDPEILRTYEKLGIPIREQEVLAGVAVDYVFDSVSVATTFKEKLDELGIIFCSISEAVAGPSRAGAPLSRLGRAAGRQLLRRAELGGVHRRLASSTCPRACAARWSCRTYFRINAAETGQFERTLIIADEGSYVSYLEGCTAPQRDENQLHAAVVELVALDDAEIKYSTVQNWYPGRPARARAASTTSSPSAAPAAAATRKISWTQVETGSAITWKYPSCILQGDNSVGEFYSVAVTNNRQQADTGTKMIHIGKNTRSRIVSKGISAGRSNSTYRGLVRVMKVGRGRAQPHPVRLDADRRPLRRAHRALHRGPEPLGQVRARGDDPQDQRRPAVLLPQRGLSEEDAVALVVNGFCREVMEELPMEFAVEAKKLLAISLEGSVG